MNIPYRIDELIELYNRSSSGHFFDKDTMRFFKSRVTDNYRRIDDKTALFITTEKGPSGIRAATLRKAVLSDVIREDGYKTVKIEIDTVGEFNTLSLYKAKKLMKEYL